MFGRKKETIEEKTKKYLEKSRQERIESQRRINEIRNHRAPTASLGIGNLANALDFSISNTERNLGFSIGPQPKKQQPKRTIIHKANGTIIIREHQQKKKQANPFDFLDDDFWQ